MSDRRSMAATVPLEMFTLFASELDNVCRVSCVGSNEATSMVSEKVRLSTPRSRSKMNDTSLG